MQLKTDLDRRKVIIELTEKELNLICRDLNNLDSVNYKTSIKFLKEIETSKLTFEFIIPEVKPNW